MPDVVGMTHHHKQSISFGDLEPGDIVLIEIGADGAPTSPVQMFFGVVIRQATGAEITGNSVVGPAIWAQALSGGTFNLTPGIFGSVNGLGGSPLQTNVILAVYPPFGGQAVRDAVAATYP